MAAKLNLSESKKKKEKKNPEKNLNAFYLKYSSGILAVVHCRGSGLEVLLIKYSLST